MGWGHNHKSLHHLTIFLLFFLIPFSTQLRSLAQGRMLVKPATNSQVTPQGLKSFSFVLFCKVSWFIFDEHLGYFVKVEVEKTILRGQLGSRPPRCERRCGSCGHCEAIQVPTASQMKTATSGVKNPIVGATDAYPRGDYSSNYKPMSWKCKCGSFIFDP